MLGYICLGHWIPSKSLNCIYKFNFHFKHINRLIHKYSQIVNLINSAYKYDWHEFPLKVESQTFLNYTL